MLRFFRTGQPVPEWLQKVSAPMDADHPILVFGSPTIVVRKANIFHCWSVTSFGRGACFYLEGTWQEVVIKGQGGGVWYHHSLLKLIRFLAAPSK